MKLLKINKYKIISLVVVLAMFQGCNDDFLQEDPVDKINSGIFWKTEQDAEQALAGVYDALQHDWLYALRSYNDGAYFFQECFTDNSMNGFLYQNYNGLKTGALTPLDLYAVRRPWQANYEGIGRANRFIDNVLFVEGMSEDDKNLMIAQSKVIRGFLYFNLLVGWDDVPLVLKSQQLDEVLVPKSTALEVYNQIIKDITEALNFLPANWPNEYGRITSGAAHALLAKVYLYGHGYLGVSDALNKAASETKIIIDSGNYGLFADFQALFTPENERCNEIIFSVRFTQGMGDNNFEGFSGSTSGIPQTPNVPLPNLADDYYCIDGLPIDLSPLYQESKYWLNRDPRWDATLVYPKEIWLTGGSGLNGARTGYAWDKYITNDNSNNVGGNGNYGQDYYLIRYADVLLMRAEALIESNQNLEEARGLIDLVRQRVGMPSIADAEEAGGAVINQSTLREILRHERRIELANENTRFMDLKRWGTMEEAYNRSKNDRHKVKGSLILNGVVYQGEKSYILPLRAAELEVNTMLEQHPAW